MSDGSGTAAVGVSTLDDVQIREVLTVGQLTITGRLTNASNATLFGTVSLDGVELQCIHKPVAGERPLWDFPTGTLANREVAAYEVSEATGWRIVPPTVMREGQWGPGMCQLWIDTVESGVIGNGSGGAGGADAADADDGSDDTDLLAVLPEAEAAGARGWLPILSLDLEDGTPAVLAHRDDARLRRIAAYDAVVNNADRKGGHLLVPIAEPTHVYGIDHGVTFAEDDKLRTLLWGFAREPLGAEVRGVVEKLARELDSGALGFRLGELLNPREVAATRARTRDLLHADRFPGPDGRQRPVPWPPF